MSSDSCPQIHTRGLLKQRWLIPNISQCFADRILQVLQTLGEPQMLLCIQERGRGECATNCRYWSHLQRLERLHARGALTGDTETASLCLPFTLIYHLTCPHTSSVYFKSAKSYLKPLTFGASSTAFHFQQACGNNNNNNKLSGSRPRSSLR